MQDPYETLGVEKSATADEIKRAYRKLVRELHPDLNPNDKATEARFKRVAQAYEILGDAEKRQQFDAGEIDATGAEKPNYRFYRDFADAPGSGGHAAESGFASSEELEEFLRRAFGDGFAQRGRQGEFQARGQDLSYTMRVDFLDAARGATRKITLPDGRLLKVQIPEGSRDRQVIRLKGQGGQGFGGGPAGDAYVELHVEPHAFFERRDSNIHVTVPVTLREAVLGGAIEVPTVSGPVKLTVPANSNTGQVLRLRGRGLLDPASGMHGHQFVKLQVVLPKDVDPKLRTFLESWEPERSEEPRKEMLR